MTIIPIIKTCPACGKKYSWNPDVGQMKCPNCLGLGIPKKNPLSELLGKKKPMSDKK